MKNAMYVLMVAALALVSSAGWAAFPPWAGALPQLPGTGTCSYKTTLDNQHTAICSPALLNLGNTNTVDIETVTGPESGDGAGDGFCRQQDRGPDLLPPV
jgi:hypothetical protein